MNPASHLLIAAPCYFTWTTFLRFFFLFLFPSEEKVSSFRSIYLSRVLVTRDSIQRSVDFAFFLFPLFSVRRRKMPALLMEIRRSFVSYPSSIGQNSARNVSNGCGRVSISLKVFPPRELWALRKTYSNRGTRRGIKCRRVPLQRGSAMLEPLALKIHNSGEIWYFPSRPLCATYFRKLFLPQKCLENA